MKSGFNAIVCLFIVVHSGIVGTRAALATDITISGSWAPVAKVSMGAGSSLVSSYESLVDEILVSILNTSAGNWRVDVRRTDTNWSSGLLLSAKRTGSGIGGGVILGGTTYQTISSFDSSIFSGSSDRNDIPVQLEISGIAIEIPPDKYSTTLVFTVVDL